MRLCPAHRYLLQEAMRVAGVQVILNHEQPSQPDIVVRYGADNLGVKQPIPNAGILQFPRWVPPDKRPMDVPNGNDYGSFTLPPSQRSRIFYPNCACIALPHGGHTILTSLSAPGLIGRKR